MGRRWERLAVWGVFLSLATLFGQFAAAGATGAMTSQQGATEEPGVRVANKSPSAAATAQKASATTRSATSPSTTAAQAIGARLREMRERKAKQATIAYFELGSELRERPADFSLFGDGTRQSHLTVLQRLKQAATDKDVSGVLVSIAGEGMDMAQAQEIRDALAAVEAKGKRTFVYADRYTMAGYTLATGAKTICLLPGGEILMPGVAVETMFARGVLDKLGVQPDFVQIGEYKGASEAFMRSAASDELRGELNRLVDGLYEQLVLDISLRRNLPGKQVRSAIDRAWMPAADAKKAGLVDYVVDIDGMRELIEKQIGREVDIKGGYGLKRERDVDLSSPMAFFQLMARKPKVDNRPGVALVYIDGMIAEGNGSEDMMGSSMAADGPIRRAMRIAERDEDVRAVVIRVNSPGGSALASEAAWQAVRRVAKKKPVVVSIGQMAASGGYYIASAGDHIFADPSAIIGSIGVVGGKVSLAGLYDKIGLETETFSRGANAQMFSSSGPFTDAQRVMLANLMRQTYDQFVDRVMQTRKGKIQDIDKVARGRIFVGKEAERMGLIDEIGGLQKALDYAAEKGKLPKDYAIRELPAPRTLADLFSGGADGLEGDANRMRMPAELQLLPASTQSMAIQQIMALRYLQHGGVMLIPPAMMVVK